LLQNSIIFPQMDVPPSVAVNAIIAVLMTKRLSIAPLFINKSACSAEEMDWLRKNTITKGIS